MRRRTSIVIAAGLVALLAGSAAGWLFWPQPAPPPVAITQPSAFHIQTADERTIRDHVATGLSIFRFADNPHILVLDFASLREQGMMLNRVAAFVEKAGLPRDRVLTAQELAAAIRAAGDTVETFYLGHDYSAATLARFFATADSEHIRLDAQEQTLRALLNQEGWFAPGTAAAVISVPAVGPDPLITAATRAAILRHELSHGEFFSNPAYAAYVHRFWLTELTAVERAGVRKFLASGEYDDKAEELMYNEMQAYLMFTRDPLFFTPELIGMAPARLAELQSRFLAGVPKGWLRNVLASYPTDVVQR